MLAEHTKGGWVPVRYRPNAASVGWSLGCKLATTHIHNHVMAVYEAIEGAPVWSTRKQEQQLTS